MKLLRLLFLTFLLISVACTKYEVQSLNDNNPSTDSTVTTEAKINYLNRVYITLLGHKPSAKEMEEGIALLNINPNSEAIRKNFIKQLTAEPTYFLKVWEDARGELLEGVDTVTIRFEYDDVVYQYNNSTGNLRLYWQEQMQLLFLLLSIPNELEQGLIMMPEMHSRATNNLIYDDINMGTENFVVSVFQNLFYRYPTNNELTEAKKMVDGQQAVLFLNPGNSKNDFLSIIYESTAYYEGQVSNLYRKYLFRDPTSSELSSLTLIYHQQKDFIEFQSELLASNEYFHL